MDAALSAWSSFFSAQVSASAALVGLVVVAISINLNKILEVPLLPGRAAEGLIVLVGALVMNSIALIPAQDPRALGVEALLVGVATFIAVLTIQLPSLPKFNYVTTTQKVLRVALTAFACLPIAIGGAFLAVGVGAGLDAIAAGLIFSLMSGVYNTWILLIEILR